METVKVAARKLEKIQERARKCPQRRFLKGEQRSEKLRRILRSFSFTSWPQPH